MRDDIHHQYVSQSHRLALASFHFHMRLRKRLEQKAVACGRCKDNVTNFWEKRRLKTTEVSNLFVV